MTRKTDLTAPPQPWREAASPPVVGSHPVEPPPQSSPPVEAPASELEPPELSEQDLEIDESVQPEVEDSTWLSRLTSSRASSWLISAAAHLIVLILLALLTYRLSGITRGVAIDGAIGDAVAAVEFDAITPEKDTAQSDGESTEQQVNVDIDQTHKARSPSSLVSPTEAIPVDPALVAELLAGGVSAPTHQLFLGGGGMSARTPEGRRKYGDRYGATEASEAAVENALKWLAAHQRSNGSWSFDLSLDPCDGRCRHGRKRNAEAPAPATAATGLALLAFLGAGYTTEEGPYKEVVRDGIYYLRDAAAETTNGYDWQQSGSMYAHGIALMAMSEALGMTRRGDDYDSDLLHYVDRGSFFTAIAQHESGSWGYTPGSPGDTTLTGWQILSLVGARKAGIQMRSDTFSKTKAFLMSVRDTPSYEFGYRTPKAEPTTTAIALTLLMYLGQTPGNTSFDQAVDKLAEQGPTLTNVYHDYYATMALHHWRHRDWEQWNQKLRDHLVATQETSGHESGSWHFPDRFGDVGGRLYTTAMSALILEVYYRFLPLYDAPEAFPL